MITACTIYDGDYHYGVAGLVNSLYSSGYRGAVYVGYRGDLPPWAASRVTASSGEWRGAQSFDALSDLTIIFLPVRTDRHLTNFKPAFMSQLLDGPASNTDALLYLDPDIVVCDHWGFIEDWMRCGVALCEDVNSPLSPDHPRRVGWRQHFAAQGAQLRFRTSQYVNGGCVGVAKEHVGFLKTWEKVLADICNAVGGPDVAKIAGGRRASNSGFADCFDATDQDALNVAIESTDIPISILGREAMAFAKGRAVLPHAVGSNKPWERSYIATFLKGLPPRTVDKQYWRHATSPIRAYSPQYAALKRFIIILSAFSGRFYSRR